MAFEIIEKSKGATSLLPNQVSVGQSSLAIGEAVSDYLAEYKAVEIYLDKENRKMGMKGTNNTLTGYVLQYKQGDKRVYLNVKKVMKMLPKGIITGYLDDDMWVFQLKELPSLVKDNNLE